MTRVSAAPRSARAQDIKQDKATAASIHEINGLNKAAKLGSVSVRFFRTGSEGYYPKSTELKPEQALLELMAGHEVEATVVTWREQVTQGKANPQPHHNAPTPRKVRTKVYGGPKKKFTNADEMQKWWGVVKETVAKQPTSTTTGRPNRSGKHW